MPHSAKQVCCSFAKEAVVDLWPGLLSRKKITSERIEVFHENELIVNITQHELARLQEHGVLQKNYTVEVIQLSRFCFTKKCHDAT